MKFASDIEDIEAIRTDTMIDRLSGLGGIPRKKITEIFGRPGLGKTTLCVQAAVAAQKQGLKVLWVDTEFAYDTRYGASLGLDNRKVGLIRERFAEDIIDAMEEAIESGKWDLVVLDSIGGFLSRTEAEKSAEGKSIGSQAGLVAKMCRKLVPLLDMTNTALIVINHEFTDIMSGRVESSGGAKLAYHKSFAIRLKPSKEVVKQGERVVGKIIIGEVRKNKLASTERMEVSSQIIFGEGFSADSDTFAEAVERGVVTKRGQSYFIGETKLGRGYEASRKIAVGTPELLEQIKALL